MKILVDLSVLELPATGVARVLTGLYDAVAAAYPDIALSGIHRRGLLTAPPRGLRATRTAGYLPPALWRSAALPLAAVRTDADAVHFPWNGGVPLLLRDRKVITTMHDILPLTIPGYFSRAADRERYRRRAQADADRSAVIITDSEFSRGELLRHLHLARVPVVIPCATSLGRFAPVRAEAHRDYFLYVGGLDPRKSLDELLRVFLRLRGEGLLRSTLVVTGSVRHAPAALLSLLEEGRGCGAVEFRGYVDDAELARLYTEAIALVYPSRFEGFGMPPLEAMTLGCPVIAPRASALPEVCGNAAFYVEPWSAEGLADTMRRFEKDEELRARLRGEGLAQAARFSWTRAAGEFMRVLREVAP